MEGGWIATYVKALELDPMLDSTTEAFIELLQSMCADVARESGGADLIAEVQKEFADLEPGLTKEFMEEVESGYGKGSGETIHRLFSRWLVERIAETSRSEQADGRTRLRSLFRMAVQTLRLQAIQKEATTAD